MSRLGGGREAVKRDSIDPLTYQVGWSSGGDRGSVKQLILTTGLQKQGWALSKMIYMSNFFMIIEG